ncbi:hypothetical protein [Streptomyces sp. NPDC058683]|uniref:hypothetical protein n=1 Tax=Streptomyces sp. NPDC058683 TaxID=3346597 RepID=UPI003669FAC1
MSPLQSALIVNAVVLATTLKADLGTKEVNGRRLRRPLFIAAAIVPLFVHTLYTKGPGLSVEVGGAAVGVLVGLIAVGLMRVHRDTAGRAVSTAGVLYAAFWIVIAVGRSVFSYGAGHWYGTRLATFFVQHGAAPGDVSGIITNGLVIMAVVALLTRSAGLMMRARTTTPVSAPAAGGTQPAARRRA